MTKAVNAENLNANIALQFNPEIQTSVGFDRLMDAAHIDISIRYLKIHRSLTEQDKLIDELLIRRLVNIRDSLFNTGVKVIESHRENKPK